MKLHFLHIGKNAGTAVKKICDGNPVMRASLIIHDHDTTFVDVPAPERITFVVRDPLSRFVSGFYHRKQKLERNLAEKRTYNQWDEGEIVALQAYADINGLLADLFSTQSAARDRALGHISKVFHIGKYGSYWNWFVSESYLSRRRERVFHVMKQETFADDVAELARKLEAGPVEIVKSRPTDYDRVPPVEDRYLEKLSSFLRREYRFVEVLQELKLVPETYLADKIMLSRRSDVGFDHFSAMKKFRGLQYTENELLFVSYQTLRRTVGRLTAAVRDRGALKKHIGSGV